jgi:hypothetical protein
MCTHRKVVGLHVVRDVVREDAQRASDGELLELVELERVHQRRGQRATDLPDPPSRGRPHRDHQHKYGDEDAILYARAHPHDALVRLLFSCVGNLKTHPINHRARRRRGDDRPLWWRRFLCTAGYALALGGHA